MSFFSTFISTYADFKMSFSRLFTREILCFSANGAFESPMKSIKICAASFSYLSANGDVSTVMCFCDASKIPQECAVAHNKTADKPPIRQIFILCRTIRICFENNLIPIFLSNKYKEMNSVCRNKCLFLSLQIYLNDISTFLDERFL